LKSLSEKTGFLFLGATRFALRARVVAFLLENPHHSFDRDFLFLAIFGKMTVKSHQTGGFCLVCFSGNARPAMTASKLIGSA
jgi:hypothetical protein